MPNNMYRILAINPGSTSTKIGLFENETPILEETIRHDPDELANYFRIADQEELRRQSLFEVLNKHGINLADVDAIVARGGVLRPIPGGTYRINDEMLDELRSGKYGEHASNLGAIIANQLAAPLGIPTYIVDPVVVDEMDAIARISGIPAIERRSIFHALNQKAVARQVAKQMGKSYEEVNFVVAHMGGGITVGAHRRGRVVDVNNGLHGEGPFSPERSGTVPFGDLVKLSFSGKYFPREVMRQLVGQGGLISYLGTSDAREIETSIDHGNSKAELIYQAMAYQISKEIGAYAAVLAGEVDRIVLTGGLAHGQRLTKDIEQRISWIAPVVVVPGENELKALTEGALRVLRGEEKEKEYPQPVESRSEDEVIVRG